MIKTTSIVSQIVDWKGKHYLYEWSPSTVFSETGYVNHIECVIFNDKNEILVMHEYGEWHIPGGAPNKGESYEDAIVREVNEEVNIVIKCPTLLGYNKITMIEKPHEKFYHLVYSAKVEELLPRQIDPESGDICEYKFVVANKVTNYVKWGNTGEAMFKRAIMLITASN